MEFPVVFQTDSQPKLKILGCPTIGGRRRDGLMPLVQIRHNLLTVCQKIKLKNIYNDFFFKKRKNFYLNT